MSVGNLHMLLSNVASNIRYQLLSSTSLVSEGDSFILTLNALPEGKVEGATVGYTIDGVDTSDITGSDLTGNFTITNNTDVINISTTNNDDTILFFYGESRTVGQDGLYKYRINQDLTSPVFESFYPGPGSNITGMFFRPNGGQFWLQNAGTDQFLAYELTAAPSVDQWDLSTAQPDFPDTGSYGTTGSNHQGMWISDTGTILVQVDRDIQTILQDDIPAWNPLNPGAPSRTLNISANTTLPTGIFVKPDGTKAFVSSIGTPLGILEYSGPAFQCNNWTFERSKLTNDGGVTRFPTDVFVDPLGIKMYISDDNARIHLYKLGTPWELSTATFLRTFDLNATFSRITGLYVVEPESEIFRVTLNEVDSLGNRTKSLSEDITISNVTQPLEVYYLGTSGFVSADINTTLIVPQGVTSVSAVVVGGGGGGGSGVNNSNNNPTSGGGGGGGGALAYGTFAVTPGEILYLQIGKGGERGDASTNGAGRGDAGFSGGTSTIRRGSFSGTVLLQAQGGHGGSSYLSTTSRYTSTPSGTELVGGGNGGLGGIHVASLTSTRNGGGGGGAGGYSGNGGQGESADGSTPNTDGAGGGGAGGNRDDFPGGNPGGGVGIYQTGSNGIAPSGNGSVGPIFAGRGGYGGGGWSSTTLPATGDGLDGGFGGAGTIRIIWGNSDNIRQYPSTNTLDFLT